MDGASLEVSEVIWGVNSVLEALKSKSEDVEEVWISKKGLSGRRLRILELANKLGIPVKVVREFRPPKIPPDAKTQGVVAYIREFPYADWVEFEERVVRAERDALVVFLDSLTDPQNVGSIIRSAEAMGATGIVLPKHRASGVTPAAVKVSCGAAFHLPIVRVTNLRHAIKRLKEVGLFVYGLDHRAESLIFEADLRGPVGIVVGSEGEGLREGVKKECDALLKIPMKGKVESLNAAVSAAIAIYEVVRQKAA